jgi:cellulose synthase/poly-beta-1,6-N-acetylglucosamine synthase-like glycosyltransferase
VDQQARMNMRLIPQFGGTVGGVRKGALLAVGGWNENTLAEDTDATYRLLLGGWKTVYQNRSECYEQVPETWLNRRRQVTRWAQGHNQTMARYAGKLIRSRRTGFFEKLDGLLLLGVYMMSPILLLGWSLALALWLMGINKPGLIIILAVTCYSTIGNFATFFEVGAATHLDGTGRRVTLMPFIFMGFLVSLFSVSRITVRQLFPFSREQALYWHKTEHNKHRRRQ